MSGKSKWLLLIPLLMICGLMGVDAYGTYPALDPNMALYLHLNNDSTNGENDTYVYDFSGNGNNGTSNNTQFQANTGILNDGSIYFNGINSSIYIKNQSMLNFPNDSVMSISLWAYANSYNGSGNSYILAKGKTGQFSYALSLNNAQKFRFQAYASSGSTHCDVNSGNQSNLNVWNYVVVTLNSTSCNMYLNGFYEKSAARNYSLNMSVTASDLYLGHMPNGVGGRFNGLIDEVIIYNKTLNLSDILKKYKDYSTCGGIPYNHCPLYYSTVLAGGTYYINGTYQDGAIQFASENITLDGNGSTIYYQSGGVLSYGIESSYFRNITIKNIKLVQVNSSFNASFAMNLYGANDSSIYNVTTSTNSPYSYGIYLRFSNNTSIFNNTFNLVNSTFTYGVHLENYVSYSNVYNNLVNSTGFNPHIGIGMELNVDYNNIFNNVIFMHGHRGEGITLNDNCSFNNISYNNITTFDGNYSYGLFTVIDLFDNDYIFNNTFTGNNVKTNGFGSYGVRVSGGNTTYNHFINNIINSSDIGIVLDNYPAHTNSGGSVLYNDFTNNTLNINDGFYDILFGNGTTNNSFYFNKEDLIIGAQNYTINQFLNLSSALIFYSNNSGSMNPGDLSISISLNISENVTILNNFNFTESNIRKHAPFSITNKGYLDYPNLNKLVYTINNTLSDNVTIDFISSSTCPVKAYSVYNSSLGVSCASSPTMSILLTPGDNILTFTYPVISGGTVGSASKKPNATEMMLAKMSEMSCQKASDCMGYCKSNKGDYRCDDGFCKCNTFNYFYLKIFLAIIIASLAVRMVASR